MTQQLQLLWYRERGWGDEWSWLHVVVISEWVSGWVAKMMRWANKPHREGMLAIGRRRRWVCTCCWGWCWGGGGGGGKSDAVNISTPLWGDTSDSSVCSVTLSPPPHSDPETQHIYTLSESLRGIHSQLVHKSLYWFIQISFISVNLSVPQLVTFYDFNIN
jgi:hypothetical protein